MNRMTSIAALAGGFAFTALSPALTQEAVKGPHEGPPIQSMEKDAQIDRAQREKAQQEEMQGRGSATSAPLPSGSESTRTEEQREDRGIGR